MIFEGPRMGAEALALLASPLFRGQDVPRGAGRPVMLVPGFMAGDNSLAVLNGWLRRQGFRVHGSGIARNVECSEKAIGRLSVARQGDQRALRPAGRDDRPQPRRDLRPRARGPSSRAGRPRDHARLAARGDDGRLPPAAALQHPHAPDTAEARRRRPDRNILRGELAGPQVRHGGCRLLLRASGPTSRATSRPRCASPRSTRAATASCTGAPAWIPMRCTWRSTARIAAWP